MFPWYRTFDLTETAIFMNWQMRVRALIQKSINERASVLLCCDAAFDFEQNDVINEWYIL